MTMIPVALVLFALGALFFAPQRAVWGTVAFGVGMLGVQVISAYATAGVATLAGMGFGIFAGGLVLKSTKGWLIALLAGLLPTVFLSIEHGGLLAWVIAVVALALLLFGRGKGTHAKVAESVE